MTSKLTVTIPECAQELNLTSKQVRRMIEKKRLKAVNVALKLRGRKCWRILRQSILDFVYDQRRAS
jgi:hypothetical protein